VAYPHHIDNPIRRFAPILSELHDIEWDNGNEHFPPTSFQVVNVQAGIGAPNVTPDVLNARFNFRYSTEWRADSLQARVTEILDRHELDYELKWKRSGDPFLTAEGTLTAAVAEAIREVAGRSPEFSTGGGTSDGRFISPAGAEVVEVGPVNQTIHKVNEQVRLDEVLQLTDIYEEILKNLLRT
jgi:succinyl-diaminopimelate desuccinylase